MQLLWVFEMEEANVTTKESKSIANDKDATLAIETSTSEVIHIKKHCKAHEMAL